MQSNRSSILPGTFRYGKIDSQCHVLCKCYAHFSSWLRANRNDAETAKTRGDRWEIHILPQINYRIRRANSTNARQVSAKLVLSTLENLIAGILRIPGGSFFSMPLHIFILLLARRALTNLRFCSLHKRAPLLIVVNQNLQRAVIHPFLRALIFMN